MTSQVAPIDDTMIISFALDAGRSLDGIGGGHGMDELSQRHLGHTSLTFKDVCGTGKKQIAFGEVAAGPRHQIRRRGCGCHLAAVPASETAAADRRRYEGLRTGRPSADPGGCRNGARWDQGRPRQSGQIVRGIRQGNGPAGNATSTKPRARNLPSAAPSNWAKFCSTSWVTRAGARARAASIRPIRRRWKSWTTKARRLPTGAGMAPVVEAEIDLYRRAAGRDQPAHRARPYQLQPRRGADRAAVLDRSQPAEHPHPHGNRAPDPRCLRGRQGQCPACRRLLADRIAAGRAYGRCRPVEGGLCRRRGHPRPHRARNVRRSDARHTSAGQDHQLRDPLRHLALGTRRAGWASRPTRRRR